MILNVYPIYIEKGVTGKKTRLKVWRKGNCGIETAQHKKENHQNLFKT